MASTYDIVVDQGSDYSLPFKFKDAEGTVKDLTGCTARMQLRRTPQADAVADELTTENDRIEVDATAGTVTVIFPHAVTSALDAGRYAYDLELIDADGDVTRVLEGAVILRQEVTR